MSSAGKIDINAQRRILPDTADVITIDTGYDDIRLSLMELVPSFSGVFHWRPLRSTNHQRALIHPHSRPGGPYPELYPWPAQASACSCCPSTY